MDPLIYVEYLHFGGAMILTLMVDGANSVISLTILLPIPGNIVFTPDNTSTIHKTYAYACPFTLHN